MSTLNGAKSVISSTSFESEDHGKLIGRQPFYESVSGWSPLQSDHVMEIWDRWKVAGHQPYSGNHFIELNTDPYNGNPDAAGIQQSFETTEGQEYYLSLQYAGRPGYGAGVNKFAVMIDGVIAGEWQQDATDHFSHDWQPLEIKFQGTGGNVEIALMETGSDVSGGRGMRIDDLEVGTYDCQLIGAPGVSATVIDGETSEDGGTAQVSVVLDTKPLEDVTISFAVSDASEARISKGQTLVFTSTNWDQAQTVMVEGIDDPEAEWLLDGAQDFILSGSLSSADPNYGPRRDGTGGVKVENISLSNLDRDDAGRTVIGTKFNDRIVLGDRVDRQTGNGPDRVYAGNGRDYVEGGGEDDSLYGENDDDTLVGGAGDDVLDGGSGEDTAVFSGRYADYTISSSSNVRDDSITVKDLRAGSADGMDVLDDVEWLQFADRSIQIDETGPAPAYRVSVSSSNVNEGDSLTTTVSTENLIAGTNLFWKLEGDVRKADLKPGRIRGKASVDADGTFTFSHSLKQDLETEGTETFAVKLYSDSRLSKEVATSGLVTVQDTSISGEPAGPIIGSSGNDRLLGTNNDDVISGEAGNDRLIGKKGDDLLMGGSGNDKLKGGLGADTFVVSSGMDKMLDVKLSQGDVIEIAGDKEYELVTKGRNVLLTLEDGSETFIKNMSVSALEEGGLQVV